VWRRKGDGAQPRPLTRDGITPCPVCGKGISGLSQKCPHCGNIRRLTEMLTRRQLVAFLSLFVLPVFFIHPDAPEALSAPAALLWFAALGYMLFTHLKGRF
jgi:predicted nucleic acid-binding Zn ribbon protein